jgi:anti-sigma B factor antagonist
MATQSLRSYLELEVSGPVATVRFRGEQVLLDEATSHAVLGELFGLADRPVFAELLLDFHNVEYLTSTTLGLLITLRKQLAAAGRDLRLRNLLPHIAEIFAITRLDRLFDIHPAEPLVAAGVE